MHSLFYPSFWFEDYFPERGGRTGPGQSLWTYHSLFFHALWGPFLTCPHFLPSIVQYSLPLVQGCLPVPISLTTTIDWASQVPAVSLPLSSTLRDYPALPPSLTKHLFFLSLHLQGLNLFRASFLFWKICHSEHQDCSPSDLRSTQLEKLPFLCHYENIPWSESVTLPGR